MTQSTSENKAVEKSIFTDEWMARNIRAEGASLTDLANAFNLDGVNVLDDEGDGVFNTELIEDKDFLRDLPFLITRWRFNTSDKYKNLETGEDGEFVSVEIAYQVNPQSPVQTGVFNDGSTGILAQLKKITAAREENLAKNGTGNDPHAGRFVRHGLRRSDYQRDTGVKDKKGEPITEAATTYYLNI
jgi:23S rRNA G2069 N7-methylase RlmK/C1962 C5-methylase RlmI